MDGFLPWFDLQIDSGEGIGIDEMEIHVYQSLVTVQEKGRECVISRGYALPTRGLCCRV